MLDKIDLSKSMEKSDYKEWMEKMKIQFGEIQRKCRNLDIPVMILFEGFGASGKGTMINHLIRPLDPRGFRVFTTEKASEEEEMRPYFWRFFTKTPPKGKMHIYDRSWYLGAYKYDDLELDEIIQFERQFTDDGVVIIKFFLAISQQEQKRRLKRLESTPNTKWRVTKDDWKNNKNYKECMEKFDRMLVQTDVPNAPWTVVESTDRRYASCKIMSAVINRLKAAIEQKEKSKCITDLYVDGVTGDFANGVLQGVDMSLTLNHKEYEKKKKNLQNRLSLLHSKMYQDRVPLVLAFEGWDAGGKGGAIKRLTDCMDPRGYHVIPVAAPNDIERAHHYLWRFWEEFPKAGHAAIFDRTWYGRVLVERVEGFAQEDEWKRAYNEINNMEKHIAKSGAVILKFWMHIDKEEQERRFKQRQETPEKQWKITDEDWRNREKWDEYEKAVDEMIVRTSSAHAPWIIVEANSKLYARIKVLETVVDALEKALLQ